MKIRSPYLYRDVLNEDEGLLGPLKAKWFGIRVPVNFACWVIGSPVRFLWTTK